MKRSASPHHYTVNAKSPLSRLFHPYRLQPSVYYENLPPPLFSKEGYILPLAKGGQEGFFDNVKL